MNATYRRNLFLSRDPSTKHRKADVKKINEYIIEMILERMADYATADAILALPIAPR